MEIKFAPNDIVFLKGKIRRIDIGHNGIPDYNVVIKTKNDSTSGWFKENQMYEDLSINKETPAWWNKELLGDIKSPDEVRAIIEYFSGRLERILNEEV